MHFVVSYRLRQQLSYLADESQDWRLSILGVATQMQSKETIQKWNFYSSFLNNNMYIS